MAKYTTAVAVPRYFSTVPSEGSASARASATASQARPSPSRALVRPLNRPSLPRRVARLAALPFVTAAITTYNRARYLPGALESVFAQTYDGDVDVLVVDDGS